MRWIHFACFGLCHVKVADTIYISGPMSCQMTPKILGEKFYLLEILWRKLIIYIQYNS